MANQLSGLISREDITALAHSEELSFDDEERISILETMRSIDVQACPGSGKTTLIAAKLILLAKKWSFSNQGICVLSHTNVAKDEIIDKLKKSKSLEAQRLLSYPHFIGTIQEFTNRFLALPLIRSNGVNEVTVDNDEYVGLANKLLEQNQFIWLKGTLNGLGSDDMKNGFLRETYRLISEHDVAVNISKTPKAWNKPANLERAKRALNQLKNYLDARGYFLYRDMYTLAQLACNYNSNLSKSLSVRFPCVFVDEMQDTQKFQDELLCEVFPLDNPEVIIQRFGDPDQAIFHGIGSEEPNDSFNGKLVDEMDYVVHKSHRFDAQIANKIKSLSHNEVPLATELSDSALADRLMVHSRGESFEHSVIVFNDGSRGSVIQKFADIVSDQFERGHKEANKFLVKVVGAVGNEIDPTVDQLKIGHYWQEYDKTKSKANFKETSLIDAVRYCRQSSSIDWTNSYSLLLKCILKLLRTANIEDEDKKYFSATSLKLFLKDKNEWGNFREAIYLMLNEAYYLDQVFWNNICNALRSIFEFQNIPVDAAQYMSFVEEDIQAEAANEEEGQRRNVLFALAENKIMHPDGFEIELSTIHGVKGETHDATLVLETKYYSFDLFAMLPHFAGERPSGNDTNQALKDKPTNVRDPLRMANKQFLRQLYVAVSRPRHLLCFAIHEDRIEEAQKDALVTLGWKVLPLSEEEL